MSRFASISSAVLAFSIPLAARAEPPSGAYAIQMGGDHAIFLPTEVGGQACESGGGVTVCFAGAISANPSGDVTGSAIADFSGEVAGHLSATFSGRVGGSTGDTQLRLAMRATGQVSSGGALLDVEARGRWHCVDDTASRGFTCSGRMKRCVFDGRHRLGCESEPSNLILSDDGGPWLLYLELATDAKGIVGGSAMVFLSTGTAVAYDLAGKYNSRTDTARLRLVGAGGAHRSTLELSKLALADGAVTAGELRYRIAGQRGSSLLPTPMGPVGGFPFPGHGQCIGGGFCDTTADTASLFGGHDGGPGTIADTIFFPILGGASRLP
ncbi:MAG: hypothetical protein WEF50_10440 [Myxococcota bacterium]